MLLKVPYCTVHEDVLLEVVLEAWQPLNEHVNMMLMEIFKMFDTSGDGYLSCDEFTVLVAEVSRQIKAPVLVCLGCVSRALRTLRATIG